MRYLGFVLVVMLSVGLSSCRKGPGPGGKAKITGKVYVEEYNATWSVLLNEYYGGDVDVFIVYGDNAVYNDKTSTHHDGTFEFTYLLPGDYTIYVYSKDNTGTSASGDLIVSKTVTITEKKEELVLSDFIILDN